jgi:hypothetical protein
MACGQGISAQHGRSIVGATQRKPGGRRAGFIVPKKSVNAGGGKGLWFRGATKVVRGEAIADEANNANLNPGTTAEAMVEGQASVYAASESLGQEPDPRAGCLNRARPVR